jgi:peptidoglycan hydrolase-like protein with peptidoglycan-binding domain
VLSLALLIQVPGWALASKSTPVKTSTTKKRTSVTAKKKTSSRSARKIHARKGSWKKRGQRTIASERTVEIQEALIREGYLKGEPTGAMDEGTKAALMKLQQENGWQTRIVPDSRALIKLGLGPKHDNLINPNTAAYSTVSDPTADVGSPR